MPEQCSELLNAFFLLRKQNINSMAYLGFGMSNPRTAIINSKEQSFIDSPFN